MSAIIITPRDQKVLAWFFFVVGLLFTAGGLAGVWLQGMFYKGGFPTAATFGEVHSAFTWPAAFTSLGTLIITGDLLASPLTLNWTLRKKFAALAAFEALVLMAIGVCGYLATWRVAGILH
ncbi:MAG TPA: hypothetical protein VHH73_15975 [Verrucomicrobiae bacterium]|nr:hypothetical protein [Verrucomicrobiae bacterium]